MRDKGRKKVLHGSLDVNDFADELRNGSDRAAAVLGQALLEEVVKQAIWCGLECSDKDKVKLVGDAERPGVLGFADQCRLAHGLGLISARGLSDLLIVGRIRNRFGHNSKRLTFESRQIRDRCDALKMTKEPPDDAFIDATNCTPGRSAYVACVIELFTHILGKITKQMKRDGRMYERMSKKYQRLTEEYTCRAADFMRRAKFKNDFIDDIRLNPIARGPQARSQESLPSAEPQAGEPPTPPAAP